MGKRGVLAVGLALAGAQAGHLLTYQLRFGVSALQVQSTGAHSYYPVLVKTSLGAAALTLTAALLLVGGARLLSKGPGVRVPGGPPLVSLLAALFTIQLALFMGQEVVEALVAGAAPDSASNLLLWGMVGQLPVAFAGATALRWLWTRVEAATSTLAALTSAVLPAPAPAHIVVLAMHVTERALVRAHAARSPFVKRGPPFSSLIRAF